ncbi:MAG: HAD hydrolase-like protein [Paracoccaceae bacterium]|nr:HAD hydrolase-like protein [Paracoccaceae bacterium]
MDTVDSIFDRYEAIRHRLPHATTANRTIDISSLLDVTEEIDAFVFDAFGVLNVGEVPITGAADRLDQLRSRGHEIRVLSNAASYDHEAAVEKFRRLGMNIRENEVITSRDASLADLTPGLWGCIAAAADRLQDIPATTLRLQAERADYDRVDAFLFLSTEGWTQEKQNILERSLRDNPRPVIIANADLVAPREGGFTREPGHYGHLLADLGLPDISFRGKPFGHVYELVEASLPGVAPDRIAMCGDTLHTDILGAAARQWRTVLVTRDGLFAGVDTTPYCTGARLFPTWRLETI